MKNILCLFLSICSASLLAQDPVIIGHRGASYLAPENTLQSIELAWELGADAAECDIRLTKDNKLIVFHDKNGKRLTGHDFNVNEVSFEEIQNYTILLKETNLEKFEGSRIPLLEDVLSKVPEDKSLVIEIKTGPEIIPYLKDVIDNHWKSGHIVFLAFDFETILAVKKEYPALPAYYLSAFKFDINKKFKDIAASDLDGVSLRYKIINKKMIKKFRGTNKDIASWTVDDPKDAQKLIDSGVLTITTNRPKWLSEQLR